MTQSTRDTPRMSWIEVLRAPARLKDAHYAVLSVVAGGITGLAVKDVEPLLGAGIGFALFLTVEWIRGGLAEWRRVRSVRRQRAAEKERADWLAAWEADLLLIDHERARMTSLATAAGDVRSTITAIRSAEPILRELAEIRARLQSQIEKGEPNAPGAIVNFIRHARNSIQAHALAPNPLQRFRAMMEQLPGDLEGAAKLIDQVIAGVRQASRIDPIEDFARRVAGDAAESEEVWSHMARAIGEGPRTNDE